MLLNAFDLQFLQYWKPLRDERMKGIVRMNKSGQEL